MRVEPRTSALITAWLTTLSCDGARLGGQQIFVQAVVHARKFARLLVANQLDALHGRVEHFADSAGRGAGA